MCPQIDTCAVQDQPCKVCHLKVDEKTGVQCQGACQTWIHFACLNYTPGKIADILNEMIEIACPCPDCKTTQPREFLTAKAGSTNYTCINKECPANQKGHACENPQCPSNKTKAAMKAKQAVGWPVVPCGKGVCSKNRAFNPMERMIPIPTPPASSCMQEKEEPKPPRTDGLNKQDVDELCGAVEELTEQLSFMMEKVGGKPPKKTEP